MMNLSTTFLEALNKITEQCFEWFYISSIRLRLIEIVSKST